VAGTDNNQLKAVMAMANGGGDGNRNSDNDGGRWRVAEGSLTKRPGGTPRRCLGGGCIMTVIVTTTTAADDGDSGR
jgi:hypothetical protein